MITLQDIKNDLPNFPEEVIETWLLPYAHDIGWPPSHSRWKGILYAKPLTFWRTTSWEKEKLELTQLSYSVDTQEVIDGLRKAYVLKEDNLYQAELGDIGHKRYVSALAYILKHGRLPKPIYLLQEKGSYSVVDGNHRFVAWWASRELIAIIKKAEKSGNAEMTESLKQSLSKKWGIDSIAPFSPTQEVWVASVEGGVH